MSVDYEWDTTPTWSEDDDDWMDCPSCHGCGEVPWGEYEQETVCCDHCGGTGLVPIEAD